MGYPVFAMAGHFGALEALVGTLAAGVAAAKAPLPDPPGYTLQRQGSRGDVD